MSRQQRWIALFALLVLAYGLGQYWTRQHSGSFRAVLLDFLPQQVQRIDIQEGSAAPFSILRQQDRWLLSGPKVNEVADQEAVEQLLKRLQAIRTEEIVSQSEQDWEEYGLLPRQGVLVCLSYDNDEQDCIRIGRYAYAAEAERVELYTRLDKQREVYAINGLPLSFLDGKINFFRNHQLLAISQPLEKLNLYLDEQQLTARQFNDSTWLMNEQEIADSLAWQQYLDNLRSLEGQHFADDIDELTLDSLLWWQLVLYSGQDSFLLKCYNDTTKTRPYILQSDQFSKTWVSSDSNGLAQYVLAPWQKFIADE